MTTAGYSGTPLYRKLGIKPGHQVAILRAPENFAVTLAPPDGVTIRRRAAGRLDVIVAFCDARRTLQRGLPGWSRALEPDGGLWIAWPKRSSGVATDLTESDVRGLGLDTGLVDNKVCAIDATWSALRFVYRLGDRSR